MSNELALLLNLIPYPKTALTTVGNPSISENLRQRYASVTESIAKNLIANLTEPDIVKNVDLDFMIKISNAAFASLSSLQVDYRKLYDAVKDYLCFKCQLLDINIELNTQMILANEAYSKRDKAHDDLVININALAEAEVDKKTIEQTFSERIAEVNAKIEDLSIKCDELETEYEKPIDDYLGMFGRFELLGKAMDACEGVKRTAMNLSSIENLGIGV